MVEASRGVLNGFEIDADAENLPDRYSDGERSTYMWETVTTVADNEKAGRVGL